MATMNRSARLLPWLSLGLGVVFLLAGQAFWSRGRVEARQRAIEETERLRLSYRSAVEQAALRLDDGLERIESGVLAGRFDDPLIEKRFELDPCCDPAGGSLEPGLARATKDGCDDGGLAVVGSGGGVDWRLFPADGRPEILGRRAVPKPDGVWTEGWVLGADAVDELLGTSPKGLELVDGAISDELTTRLTVAPWSVTVDPQVVERAASAAAERVLGDFRRNGIAGLALLVLAAAAIFAFVYQTERVGHERERMAMRLAAEISEPMASLRNVVERLRRESAESGTLEAALEVGRQLARIERGLEALPGREGDSATVRLPPGDLAQAVSDILTELEPTVAAAGGRLASHLAGDLPPVRFDRDAIARLVQGLVENAERYSRHCLDRSVNVQLLAGGPGVVLIVEDRGPGLPERVRSKMSRGLDRAAPNEGALGRGLPLVAAVARSHGALLDWEDRSGGGTRFLVSFPVERAVGALAPAEAGS